MTAILELPVEQDFACDNVECYSLWFEHCDTNNPTESIPESDVVSEQRIYVWLLLRRVFNVLVDKTRNVAFLDVYRFVTTLWFDPAMIRFDTLEYNPTKRFSYFMKSFNAVIEMVNYTGINHVSPEVCYQRLFSILRQASPFWQKAAQSVVRMGLDYQNSVDYFTNISESDPDTY